MNRLLIRAGIVLASVVILLFLALLAPTPVLYGPEDTSSTPLHEHPSFLNRLGGEEAAQIQPLISDLLGQTGTVTLSLQAKDFSTAERDLRVFLDQSQQFGRLIIRLNLTDSDLEAFRQQNEQNLLQLQEMLNLTERFSELERLEVTYKSEKDPDLLYSLSYEGEAIRTRLSELAQEYTVRRETVTTLTQTFELDHTPYEESLQDITEIARQVEVQQTTRMIEFTTEVARNPSLLSLLLQPDTVSYGDQIQVRGILEGDRAPGTEITLYLDSQRWSVVSTNGRGAYQTTLSIWEIRPGTHLLYAMAGSTYSEIRSFSVLRRPSTLTLSCTGTAGSVFCEGHLSAGSIPVRDASLEIRVDGVVEGMRTTDLQGAYAMNRTLEPGRHTISVQFLPRRFPLDPAKAETEVTVGEDIIPPFSSLLLTGLIPVIGIAASWGYLQVRVRRRRVVSRSLGGVTPLAPGMEPFSAPEPVLPRFDHLIEGGQVVDGLQLLRRDLAVRIGVQEHVQHPHSLTPRELLRIVKGRPYAPLLAGFLDPYEVIRYGGNAPAPEMVQEMRDIYRSLLESLGGGSH